MAWTRQTLMSFGNPGPTLGVVTRDHLNFGFILLLLRSSIVSEFFTFSPALGVSCCHQLFLHKPLEAVHLFGNIATRAGSETSISFTSNMRKKMRVTW